MKKHHKVIVLFIVLSLTAVLLSAPAVFADKGKQTKCPVMGYDINKNIYEDYMGKRVYFCCPSCKKEFAKDPEKYMKALKDKGIEPEKAPGS